MLRPPQVRTALAGYLLSIADDELILGHRHSEWTGFAPDIESDVALSSVAQEEIGHAKLFYERACDLLGGDPDALAYGRPPDEFRNAVFVERPNGDWDFTIARMFLYDHADAVRLDALAAGSVPQLSDLAKTIRREERYHLIYGEQWLRRLAQATPDSRARMQQALDRAWPDAWMMFEPVDAQSALADAGIMHGGARDQLRSWQALIEPVLDAGGLKIPSPPDAVAVSNGRKGGHTDDLRVLLDEMTSVWRTEPGARW
ncbi:MAG: 1,2-phenylacetyl-CoA epoxidase subunit PaaC [Gaiellales bacterium]